MATEITTDDIATLALQPSEIQGDQGSMKQRPIKELLEARAAITAATASTRSHRGARFTQLINTYED